MKSASKIKIWLGSAIGLLCVSFFAVLIIPQDQVADPGPLPICKPAGQIISTDGTAVLVTRPLTDAEILEHTAAVISYESYSKRREFRLALLSGVGIIEQNSRLALSRNGKMIYTLAGLLIFAAVANRYCNALTDKKKKKSTATARATASASLQGKKTAPDNETTTPKKVDSHRPLRKVIQTDANSSTHIIECPEKAADVDGVFSLFSQTTFVQMLSQNCETGLLQLRSDSEMVCGNLYLRNGQIIDAITSSTQGEEAAYLMLQNRIFKKFSFYKLDTVDRETTIICTTTALLLESQHRAKECDSVLDLSAFKKDDLNWSETESMLTAACQSKLAPS